MTDPRREEYRAISIQCVAEMAQGLTILEREVSFRAQGLGPHIKHAHPSKETS